MNTQSAHPNHQPLIVISAVGLCLEHLGEHTPALSQLAQRGAAAPLSPAIPAVTTTGQATMLTGTTPEEHGIVANGWLFHELSEIWFWRQSEALMQKPPLWEGLERDGKPLSVLKHFWWYAMNSSADYHVTPRPVYHHDGRKSPDIYASSPELKKLLTDRHGAFPLFNFWGPMANITSTRWIAESFTTAFDHCQADLNLVYLPHLDYDLQRYGPNGPHLAPALKELDNCIGTIVDHAAQRQAQVMVVSEYGIEAVDRAIFINRALREAGLLTCSSNAAGELLDTGMSRAFAVCDHQLAHVYVKNPKDLPETRKALEALPDIECLYEGDQRAELGLNHPRSGDLVCMAAQGAWFTYDYWLDDSRKPDFAQSVEIHKKPGYDPRELFFDPHGGKFRAAKALLKKKLGLRYLLDPVPLDTSLVKGSHGRPPSRPELGPLIISPKSDLLTNPVHQQDVAGIIQSLLTHTKE